MGECPPGSGLEHGEGPLGMCKKDVPGMEARNHRQTPFHTPLLADTFVVESEAYPLPPISVSLENHLWNYKP